MPEYETICMKCDHVWPQNHMMREPHEACPKCKSTEVCTHIGSMAQVRVRQSLDADWPAENGGRGRYFPQLEDSVDCSKSAKNCFRSRNEAMEACKRRGFTILEK